MAASCLEQSVTAGARAILTVALLGPTRGSAAPPRPGLRPDPEAVPNDRPRLEGNTATTTTMTTAAVLRVGVPEHDAADNDDDDDDLASLYLERL